MSEIKLQERLREPVISTALKAGDFTWEHAERLIKDRVEAADALDAAESRISAQERHLTAIEVALGVHPYFGGAPLSSLVGKLNPSRTGDACRRSLGMKSEQMLGRSSPGAVITAEQYFNPGATS